jgi:hypothetical protein
MNERARMAQATLSDHLRKEFVLVFVAEWQLGGEDGSWVRMARGSRRAS